MAVSGDLIVIQPSAVSVMRHWPDMYRELEEDKVDVPSYYIRYNGEVIYGPSAPIYNNPEHLAECEGHPFVGPVQIRNKFFTFLLRPITRLALKVDYGYRVDRYFED